MSYVESVHNEIEDPDDEDEMNMQLYLNCDFYHESYQQNFSEDSYVSICNESDIDTDCFEGDEDSDYNDNFETY
jgi:hypothetical protein